MRLQQRDAEVINNSAACSRRLRHCASHPMMVLCEARNYQGGLAEMVDAIVCFTTDLTKICEHTSFKSIRGHVHDMVQNSLFLGKNRGRGRGELSNIS